MTTHTKDIMSKKLVTLSIGATLSEAAHIMAEQRVRHLPVVDDKDGIVGVLSTKDFPKYGEYSQLNVEFFMSTPVIYVHQDTPIRQAILKMLEHKISCILIADDKNDAVGIMTTDDLLWYLAEILNKEKPEETKRPFFDAMDAQTLGQVAHQISLAGI